MPPPFGGGRGGGSFGDRSSRGSGDCRAFWWGLSTGAGAILEQAQKQWQRVWVCRSVDVVRFAASAVAAPAGECPLLALGAHTPQSVPGRSAFLWGRPLSANSGPRWQAGLFWRVLFAIDQSRTFSS